jgi:hypothetical protein
LDQSTINNFDSRLRSKEKTLFMLKLFNKIDKLQAEHFQRFQDERAFFEKLMFLQESFCNNKYRATQLFLYIVERFNNIWVLLELLEQKIMNEYFALGREGCFSNLNLALRHYLISIYQRLF